MMDYCEPSATSFTAGSSRPSSSQLIDVLRFSAEESDRLFIEREEGQNHFRFEAEI